MAIFIDKRPGINPVVVYTLLMSLIFLFSGMKGCNSDYAKDKLTETNTAVVVVSKNKVSSGNSEFHKIKYKTGNGDGELSVTEDTFREAKPGKTMYFTLSKSDYEGYGWTAVFWFMYTVGLIAAPVSLVWTAISIFRRYL